MAKRYVRQTGKDKDGDITRLCNSGQPWSPRAKVDASVILKTVLTSTGSIGRTIRKLGSESFKVPTANTYGRTGTRPTKTIWMTCRTADWGASVFAKEAITG